MAHLRSMKRTPRNKPGLASMPEYRPAAPDHDGWMALLEGVRSPLLPFESEHLASDGTAGRLVLSPTVARRGWSLAPRTTTRFVLRTAKGQNGER